MFCVDCADRTIVTTGCIFCSVYAAVRQFPAKKILDFLTKNLYVFELPSAEHLRLHMLRKKKTLKWECAKCVRVCDKLDDFDQLCCMCSLCPEEARCCFCRPSTAHGCLDCFRSCDTCSNKDDLCCVCADPPRTEKCRKCVNYEPAIPTCCRQCMNGCRHIPVHGRRCCVCRKQDRDHRCSFCRGMPEYGRRCCVDKGEIRSQNERCSECKKYGSVPWKNECRADVFGFGVMPIFR